MKAVLLKAKCSIAKRKGKVVGYTREKLYMNLEGVKTCQGLVYHIRLVNEFIHENEINKTIVRLDTLPLACILHVFLESSDKLMIVELS